jgi:hypothetical protein
MRRFGGWHWQIGWVTSSLFQLVPKPTINVVHAQLGLYQAAALFAANVTQWAARL